MNPPTVSAIVVNWNGREHLDSCIGSLLGLRPSLAELLVVDNGSTDGSVDHLRSGYPSVRILENKSNLGFAGPNWEAAQQAQGDLLLFLNNDMRIASEALQHLLPPFSDPSVAAVGLRILDWEGRVMDFDGASLQYLGYATQKNIGRPYSASDGGPVREELFACGGAMLARRSEFLRLGGFDPDFFAIYEDVDFGWRTWLSGLRVLLAPQALAYHRGHGTFSRHSSEKMRYLMHRNALLTVLKNYDDQNFQKVFPVAIVLSIKRALEFSRVDREGFYLWARQDEALKHSSEDTVRECRDAINHLVALDDVLTRLDFWLEKRAAVQVLRARPDSEIVRLFDEPLRIIMDRTGYLEAEEAWIAKTGLGKLFGPIDPGRAALTEQRLHQKLYDLRRNIQRSEAVLEDTNAKLRNIEQRTGQTIDVSTPGTRGVFYRLRRRLSGLF